MPYLETISLEFGAYMMYAPNNLFEQLKDLYFDNLFDSGICDYKKIKSDEDKIIVVFCNKKTFDKNEKLKFPSIFFDVQELVGTFELNYKDVFMTRKDKVFLLSSDEIKRYLPNREDRECDPTEYVIEHKGHLDPRNSKCWWWARENAVSSPAKTSSASYITGGGEKTWRDVTSLNSVRPAIWVDNTGLSTAGHTIYFGRYEQDNNLENGPEPIEWIVLDAEDGKSLLISKYILDAMPFHESESQVNWDGSSIRRQLNSSFFSDAFSNQEQNAIVSSSVDNSKEQGNPAWTSRAGANTWDYIFLLSYAEAKTLLSDEERSCKPTDYAVENGVNQNADGYSWWWLRSAGFNSSWFNSSKGTIMHNFAGIVGSSGSLGNHNYEYNKQGGLRPALWVDQEKLKLAVAQGKAMEDADLFRTSGNEVQFGRYEQDGNAENGPEPIEWIVLDTQQNKSLLISKYGLTSEYFDRYGTFGKVTWEASSLRKWLNQDFLTSVFSEEEQPTIVKTYVDNSAGQGNTDYKSVWMNNTNDQVYLLSYAEINKYFPDNESRACLPKSEVAAQTVSVDKENGLCRWWLRSPGSLESQSMYVDSDGSCHSIMAQAMYAVRPVIWVDLAKLEAFRTNQIMGQLKF